MPTLHDVPPSRRSTRKEEPERRCLELLRDIGGAVLWEADPFGLQFSFVSDTADALLGIPAGDWRAERGFLRAHVHLEDWHRVSDALYQAAADGSAQTCEHRMLRADGTIVRVRTSVRGSTDPDGALAVHGITMSLGTAERDGGARQDEALHQLLAEGIRDCAFFLLSLDGEVQTWNVGAQRLALYRSEEILGASAALLFPSDDVARGVPVRLIQQAAIVGYVEYDGKLIRKGGEAFWALAMLTVVTDELGRARGIAVIARDVTGRRQAEEGLRRSEQQFRLLVDSVQDYAVFMVAPEGKVESWNRGAQRLKGYRAHEILGAHLDRFFPPDEVAKGTPGRMIEQAALSGTSTYEGWLVRKGGSQFWALMTLGAVEDEGGRLIGFSNVSRDLSERKRTEEALRESEEGFRRFVESVQDYGMFMVTLEGRVAGWNPGAARLKGYRTREICGEHLAVFFPPEEVERGTPARLLERAAAEGAADYEGWLVRKNASRFWSKLTLSLVTDDEGNPRGFSNVSQDITERMRAERAQAFLSEAGAALAGSLDQKTTLDEVARLATRELAEGCILHLVEGEVIRPAAVAHADPAKEQLARSALRSVPLQMTQPHGAAFVVRTGKPDIRADASDVTWAAEALGIQPPEALREIGLSAYLCVPLTARGRTFGAVTFLSTRGSYGAREAWLAEELARRAALALENARLYQEAQEAVRAQDEFIAIASHDLRGPLQTIQLQVHTLLGRLEATPGEPPSRVGAGLENVHKQVRRMVQMFDTLLDISRITSGRLVLDREKVDLSALVRECAARVADEAAAAGCELRVRADAAVVGSWDRLRVEQVVTNLLSNAIKYGKGGPIDVFAGMEGEGTTARLTVRDHGAGIPPEHQARIFERFERASGDRHVGGFGMGLWIVGRILEAHGGSIHVDSQIGTGTTFLVDLPIAR